MLNRFCGLLKNLAVHPEKMMANIGMTRGVIFSQMVLLKLIDKGMSREAAYAVVQRNAMRSWREGLEFEGLISGDLEIRRYLNAGEIEKIFDLRNFLKHLDDIFRRVFGRGA
jgi:adenylosuccinate lyase